MARTDAEKYSTEVKSHWLADTYDILFKGKVAKYQTGFALVTGEGNDIREWLRKGGIDTKLHICSYSEKDEQGNKIKNPKLSSAAILANANRKYRTRCTPHTCLASHAGREIMSNHIRHEEKLITLACFDATGSAKDKTLAELITFCSYALAKKSRICVNMNTRGKGYKDGDNKREIVNSLRESGFKVKVLKNGSYQNCRTRMEWVILDLEYNKKKGITPREYQMSVINEVEEILNKPAQRGLGFKHAYIQAPCGFGKTPLSLYILETFFVAGKTIFATPRQTLDEQNIETKNAKLGKGCPILITTVQKLTAIAKKGETHKDYDWCYEADCIVFDEIHMFGTNKEKLSMMETIIKELKPKSVIYVSATAFDLNEDILGKREGRKIEYSYLQASQDKIINPVDLTRVVSADKMIIDIESYIDETGKQVDELIRCVYDANGIERQAYLLKRHKVSKDDLNTIVEHKITNCARIHAKENKNKQALFFIPNLRYINFTVKELQKYNKNIKTDFITHKICRKQKVEKVDKFKNKETDIMIVCGMLKEGFDYDSLGVVYDCSYSPQNFRDMLQKLGRIQRPAEGKGVSKYYYVVDCLCLLRARNKKGRLYLDKHLEFLPTGDIDAHLAWVDAACAQALADNQKDNNPKLEAAEVRARRIRGIKLYTIRLWDINGFVKHPTVRLSDISRGINDSSYQKEQLLNLPEGSPRPAYRTRLGNALSSYTSLSSRCYDLVFTKKVYKKFPHWFKELKSINYWKQIIIRLPKNSPKPKPKDEIYAPFMRLICPSSRDYDVEFKKELEIRFPHWFKSFEQYRRERALSILERTKNCENKPRFTDCPSDFAFMYRLLKGEFGLDDIMEEFKNTYWAKKDYTDEAREIAKKRGGECLSSFVKTIGIKIKLRCNKGHEWYSTFENIRKGHWCIKCARQELYEKLKGQKRGKNIRNSNNEFFNTIVDAGKKYSISPWNISYALKNDTQCAGFYWKYV